jgi:hypothetical protein
MMGIVEQEDEVVPQTPNAPHGAHQARIVELVDDYEIGSAGQVIDTLVDGAPVAINADLEIRKELGKLDYGPMPLLLEQGVGGPVPPLLTCQDLVPARLERSR